MNSTKPEWYQKFLEQSKFNESARLEVLGAYLAGLEHYADNLWPHRSDYGVCFYLQAWQPLIDIENNLDGGVSSYSVWEELCACGQPTAVAWESYLGEDGGRVYGRTPERLAMVEQLRKELEEALA